MMNHTFSFPRFFLLLRKHYLERHRYYLMSAVVAAGMIAFMFFISYGSGYDQRLQQFIMQGGLVIGGAIFSSTLFKDMSAPAHGILSLSLPASHLEKFLCAWVYGVILFLPAYFLVFYGVDIAAVTIGNATLQLNDRPFQITGSFLSKVLAAFFLAQSIGMLGSITFRGWHFVRTAFIVCIAIILILLLDNFLADWFIAAEKHRGGILAGGIWLAQNGQAENQAFLPIPDKTKRVTEFVFFLLPLLFWLTAYFKLKEKQL